MNNLLQSSFPPSRVFKVIQSRHAGKEQEFLRKTRERLFAVNENIAEDRAMIRIVDKMGLDGKSIVGAQSLDTYVKRLESVLKEKPTSAPVPALTEWFSGKEHLFAKEIEVMYDLQPDHVDAFIAE